MAKLIVFDTLSGTSGYSRNIAGLTIALHELGCNVKVCEPKNDLYTPDRAKSFIINDWDETVKLIDKDTIVMGRTFNNIHNYRQFNPKEIHSILVLEGDKFPEDWILKANLVDCIWASSTYNKEMLEKNNCAAKIVVLHHGFDPTYFWNKWDKQEYPRSKFTETFKFLFVGGHTNPMDRKGAQFLAEAFNVFNKEDDVSLTFKINTAYQYDDFNPEKHLRSLVKPELQNKLTFITENLSEEALGNLYRSADVSVTPTMGEAYCQSIAESLACGTACIVTNYSGHLDYCEGGSLPIDVEKRVLAHYGGFDVPAGSVWVKPSVEHLKELLKYAYDNPELVDLLGKKGSRDMHENFTWKHIAEKTKNLLKL